jgi:MraZ protein
VFVGEYDRSVDGTGRLALPADFRDDLGAKCYLRCHPDGFVSITTIVQFEIEAAQLEERVKAGEAPLSALRVFGVSSSVAAIDKQGRITLDEELRAHAGIAPGGQAVIAGAVNKLEVWRPSRYQTIRGEDTVVEPARVWVDEGNDS